jgi:hypothetical protein
MTKVVRALPRPSARFHLGGPLSSLAARLRAARSRSQVSPPRDDDGEDEDEPPEHDVPDRVDRVLGRRRRG